MREKGTGSLRKGEGGFTIIEMLVALTLLVTAMVPLAVILSTSLRTTSGIEEADSRPMQLEKGCLYHA